MGGAAVKVLIAPDSFKGTYRAAEVADAVAAGAESAGLETIRMPVADGGDGTLAVLTGPLGLELIEIDSVNPWRAPCAGSFGLGEDGTAVVELATFSGITTPHKGFRDPMTADTYGTGLAMAEAVRRGATHVVVAAGGSATTDGGLGAIAAVMDAGGLGTATVTVLTDVTTRYTDAARVFGPQKGADATTVERLTRRLEDAAVTLPRDPREVDGTGAAGGFRRRHVGAVRRGSALGSRLRARRARVRHRTRRRRPRRRRRRTPRRAVPLGKDRLGDPRPGARGAGRGGGGIRGRRPR